ncbi:MAG: sigma-70 family RNA polymerase sigma factor [Verrucomicrobiaceae bacterium]|nr:sigma-70 family RNA polymerase sigma factor [Verrucomicrobiaceae bacterium]
MLESDWTPPVEPPIAEGEVSDEENVRLMLRVKEGDESAFARLVEIHQNAVIGTATRMLGNAEDGHDVAQMVFLRVWKSASRYEPTAKFTTWLYTIMRNLVFNEMRRRGRKREISLDEPTLDDQPRDLPDNATVAPDVRSQQEELEAAIDAAIAALPEKQRLAVIMRRYQETPYEELCEVLGMSLPAVKSLLFRARAELRKHLQAHLEDEPG